jgi:hypothetical protein
MADSGVVPDIVLEVEHHERGWRDRLNAVADAQPADLVSECSPMRAPGSAAPGAKRSTRRSGGWRPWRSPSAECCRSRKDCLRPIASS